MDHGQRSAKFMGNSGNEVHLLPRESLGTSGEHDDYYRADCEQRKNSKAYDEISIASSRYGSIERSSPMINHNLPARSAVELGRARPNEQVERKITRTGLRFVQRADEPLALNLNTFSKDDVHLIVEDTIDSEALLEQSWEKSLPDIIHIQTYDRERRLLQHCDHVHPDALTFRVVLWLFHFLELDQESNQ